MPTKKKASLRPQPSKLAGAGRGPLWQAFYRWHFAAGLLLLPFFCLLAVTGIVYLFKPQIEPELYKAFWKVSPGTQVQSADRQVASAKEILPGSKAQAYRYPLAADDAAQFTMKDEAGAKWRVWVDPYTAKVTGKVPEDGMLMQIMHDLHGKLLLGKPGAIFMDLVAAWGIVLLLTGVVVWWPRSGSGAGVWYPRLSAGGRTFWRDLHSVPAAYTGLIILGFLFTGLAWTEVTGDQLKKFAKWTHTDGPPSGFGPSPFKIEAPANAKEVSLDKVVTIAKDRLPGAQPWIRYPAKPGLAYVINHKAPKPQDRAYIHVNPYTAEVLGDFRWKDHGIIGRFTAMSVSLHEGTWFGAWNQALNTFTALMVLLLAFTGVIIWWKRRPSGALGMPAAPPGWKWPWWLWVMAILLGAAMPTLGVSLLLLFVVGKALK